MNELPDQIGAAASNGGNKDDALSKGLLERHFVCRYLSLYFVCIPIFLEFIRNLIPAGNTKMLFEDSYIGKLRTQVGRRTLLVPGARVIIERNDGKILLQHRRDFSIWGLPGGNAEEGEDLVEVAIRETREETGLTVNELRPYGFASDPEFETIQFPNGDVCQFFVMMFYTSAYDGLVTCDHEEALALDWFSPSDLPDMLENMKRSVAAYITYNKTGRFQLI